MLCCADRLLSGRAAQAPPVTVATCRADHSGTSIQRASVCRVRDRWTAQDTRPLPLTGPPSVWGRCALIKAPGGWWSRQGGRGAGGPGSEGPPPACTAPPKEEIKEDVVGRHSAERRPRCLGPNNSNTLSTGDKRRESSRVWMAASCQEGARCRRCLISLMAHSSLAVRIVTS